MICADCYIFGNHKEHQLTKKNELKDFSKYLLGHLEKTFSDNCTIKDLRKYSDAESYVKEKIENKLSRSKDMIERRLDVNYN